MRFSNGALEDGKLDAESRADDFDSNGTIGGWPRNLLTMVVMNQ